MATYLPAETAVDKVFNFIMDNKCGRGGTYSWESLQKEKKTNCNASVSVYLQLAGVLKSGTGIGHDGKSSKLKGESNLISGRYKLIKNVNKLFKDLPDEYKKKGIVYIQYSNAFASAGGGKVYSCNEQGTQTRSKVHKSGGYPFNHPVSCVIIPIQTGLSLSDTAVSSIDRNSYIKKYGNEARVYFGLRDLGYTHKATCAMMGNINQESGFRTNAISYDGYGSVGICQWTFGRKTNLINFANSKKLNYLDINCQIKFLDYELKNSEKSAYKVVKNDSLSLKEMTEKFEQTFERAGVPVMENRIKSAQTYYTRYNGVSTGGSTQSQESGYDIDFNRTTSKLSSSDNFNYLEQNKNEQESQSQSLGKSLGNAYKNAFDKLKDKKDTNIVPNIEPTLGVFNNLSYTPPKKSTFINAIKGSKLPVYKTIVEAPFVEVDINGNIFGTYQRSKKLSSYPNYVQSIDVTKTNGTLNEYTIQLIHQISPGDNPNYIASILSNIGFNTIKISYGDANSGSYFSDVEALITDVKTSFDFSGCNIKYTIYASSLSYLTASTKLNFPAVTSKPSSVIIDLLKGNKELIKDYFSGMTNVEKVMSNGLIPTNDAVVEISSVTNKTLIDYLTYLVSLMKNENESIADKSTYYLCINDNIYADLGNTFSIKEIISDTSKINELIYEVDLGYPDDNLVFNFSVNTNYGWAAAMETSSQMTTYKYDINNAGNVNKTINNNLINPLHTSSEFEIDKNTWKQLTRFPITATLTIKGLMAPIMLLTYIRVNNYYYGNKRVTSGLYIVTEQKDSISGSGCRTTLGLTRVASDVDSLRVDGRVIT